jgi:hypothetical protein
MPTSADHHGTMTANHEKAIADVETLIEAIDAAVRHLQADKRALRRAVNMLSGGSQVAETLAETRASDVRQGANDVLDALTTARHHSRLSIFAAGLDEGMTIGELARAWGFSRQLASRYAREARATPEP